eukprot:5253131-Amphidinium_carterae.1
MNQASQLPKLDLKASESSTVVMQVQNWLLLCSTAINTWGIQAVGVWQAAVHAAKESHTQWCLLTPAQRALQSSTIVPHFQMTPPVSMTAAHIKSELLTIRVLPDAFVTYALARRTATITQILELLLQM